ncbi:hypothetical protein LTR36_004900 [Oleoguttula mirabilis]|uniref:F-box domain-containing protein n=1 Tax=Oleoguttula mirabilis TaxID=1507867 RepID=A0AAV9JFG1_9PEZI|nr:hypothetical protein LTR36_004900 [Oleoguttula mirabilis]
MTSILAALPPELLSRIISFLSDKRKDISTCRLVCQTFKELASPYLITRVVFALRLDAVSRLHDVLRHPYFSRYVTELVYDASLYDSQVAGDWNEYVQECQEAPRSFVDPDWAKRKRTEARLWHRFDAYSSLPRPNVLSSMDMLMTVPSLNMPHVHIAGQDVLAEDVQNLFGDDITGLDDGGVDDEEAEDYYEHVYRLGCHKGFPDYYLRHKTQCRMQEARLPANMLQHVLARLPKLRTIHFTDYRHLSTDRESYDQCCHRLFGNRLEPCHISGTEGCWNALLPLLNAVAVSPAARIDQLSLAANPYTRSVGDCVCDVESAEPRVPAALPLSLLSDMGELCTQNLTQVFSNLRRLELPFVFGESDDPDDLEFAELIEDGPEVLATVLRPLRGLLEAAAPNLTHLTLSVQSLAEHRGDSQGRPVFSRDDAHVPIDGATLVFELLLSATVFPRLQYLELGGWVCSIADMQKFLAKHQALTELRLVNNFFLGRAEELARWGGKNMCLEGVRIANWADVLLPDADSDPFANVHRLRRTEETVRSQAKADRLTDKDLEALWLAGRMNHAASRGEGFVEHDGPWWMQKRN